MFIIHCSFLSAIVLERGVQRRMDTTEWLGVVRGGMPGQGTIVTQTILGPRRRASDTTLAGDVKMSINTRCLTNDL